MDNQEVTEEKTSLKMTEDAGSQRPSWVPKGPTQDIPPSNDGWLGSGHQLFETEGKKWHKDPPKEEEKRRASQSTNKDWLGGGGNEEAGTRRASHPAPVKIEGYESHIKDNPFLNKH